MLVAMDIKDDTRKRAMMLHYARDEVNGIFEILASKRETNVYKKGKDAITTCTNTKICKNGKNCSLMTQ